MRWALSGPFTLSYFPNEVEVSLDVNQLGHLLGILINENCIIDSTKAKPWDHST